MIEVELNLYGSYRWQWMVHYGWVSSWGLSCSAWLLVEPVLFDPITNKPTAWARELTYGGGEFIVDGPAAAGVLTYVR